MTHSTNQNILQTILDTVDEFVDFIKPTYGPAENKVLIHKPYESKVLDDGVAIAQAYVSDDPVKNAIISVIKEVAIKTNEKVGDGTTSSLIMLQALMQEIVKSNKSPREVVEELERAAEEAQEHLRAGKKEIKTKADLNKIANISFNNPQIAEIVSSLIHELGPEAVITTEQSQATETTFERVEGLEIPKGFISPYFVNSPNLEAVITEPLVLITNYRLTSGHDMKFILETAARGEDGEGKNGVRDIFIIADGIEQDALATLIANNSTVQNPQTGQTGAFKIVAVNIPGGANNVEFIEDLAMITGATTITSDKQFDWKTITWKHFGKCGKIVSSNVKTILFGGGGDKKAKENAIENLKNMIAEAPTPHQKEKLERRLAKFTNGIATIKLAASTESEQKALQFKVEDQINATKAAYKGGVVCGAGLALARTETSSPILNKALKYPFQQLKENSELEIELHTLKDNEAIDATTKKTGDFLKLGIIDPVEVLCAGVNSAVSIASLLITMKGIIYDEPDDPKAVVRD